MIQGDGFWDEINWPYPQVRIAGNYILGLSVDNNNQLVVYELLNENDIWTATNIRSLGSVDNIDFVDVEGWGPYYVVTASKIVNNILTTSAFARYPNGTVAILPNVAVPEFATLCDFNGQAIIGCIQSDSAPWSGLLYSSVAWSGIGGGFDFRPTEPGNETAGFIHIPATGQGTGIVRKVKKLNKVVMAYTEDESHVLIPHSVGRSGFGRKGLGIAGIRNGNHIAGNDNIHLLLNTNNELNLINDNLEVQVLGYKEYMEDLDNEEVRITYVPQKKRFYISDSSRGFVLTEHGLYECHQCVTSSMYYRGRILCGFFYDSEDWEPRLVTDTLDFKVRGFKTIHSIETDVRYNDGCDEVYMALGFRSQYQTSKDRFYNSDWVRLNPMGIAYPIVSANEFRIMLKGVDYRDSDLRLSRLDVKYQFHDKRNMRGLSNARTSSTRPDFG